jgi:hypothetical protein
VATTRILTTPNVAKSPRSGALVALGKAFSFPVFLGALLVAGVFLNLCIRLQSDASLPTGHWHITFLEGDTFLHIAAGQRIPATHTWPTTNYYSFTTPKSEWLAYEWLGEVIMAAGSRPPLFPCSRHITCSRALSSVTNHWPRCSLPRPSGGKFILTI